MKIPEQLENILLSVQKPARYTGGELNSIVKDKREVDLRFAFCFPDTYEVGMSHLGMKILYSLLNAQKGIWCERVVRPLRGYGRTDACASHPAVCTGKHGASGRI